MGWEGAQCAAREGTESLPNPQQVKRSASITAGAGWQNYCPTEGHPTSQNFQQHSSSNPKWHPACLHMAHGCRERLWHTDIEQRLNRASDRKTKKPTQLFSLDDSDFLLLDITSKQDCSSATWRLQNYNNKHKSEHTTSPFTNTAPRNRNYTLTGVCRSQQTTHKSWFLEMLSTHRDCQLHMQLQGLSIFENKTINILL